MNSMLPACFQRRGVRENKWYSERYVRESHCRQYGHRRNYFDYYAANDESIDGWPIRAVGRLFFVICDCTRRDDRAIVDRVEADSINR